MASYQLLITPGEVVSLAFAADTGLTADSISDAVIVSCQEKFIKPVVNGLYTVLLEGSYPEFTEDYIKPALAWFVKASAVTDIAYSFGDLGITILKGTNLEACSRTELDIIRKTIKKEAMTLLRRAVVYLEENAAAFPEYDPQENILNRVTIGSQFVL